MDGKRLTLVGALAWLGCAATARAQEGTSQYEQIYGKPTDVTIEDLVRNPMNYERQAVHTKGRLGIGNGMGRNYVLSDNFGSTVRVVAVNDVAEAWDREAMDYLGGEVEVTGLFHQGSSGGADPSQSGPLINFWRYLGPPRKHQGPIQSENVTLEQLVTRPGSADRKTVKIVGKFRGKNLFGDLPAKSEQNSSDWVIKDDVFAVWITGKKPKGQGWDLDSSLKRDTGHWIEVVGKPETRNGVTYIHALQVELTSAPRPVADAAPPPPPKPRPPKPPVVVFALPLDGEADLPPDSRFVVQFSKDMDEATFQGRVVLRYAGPVRPGDRPLDGVRLHYDGGRRALLVDPGDVLRAGRQIELLLLPGITDIEGLTLVPRVGEEFEGVVDVLRYRIGT
jgi:hypothetical protein